MDNKPTSEKELLKDKKALDHKRSSKWSSVRKQHLKNNPRCALCDGIKKLEVHHIKPFHLHPELELDPDNLITLCEDKGDGVYCHLFFGHLGNFHSINADVKIDIEIWREKLKNRKNASS
jgi:5-methylcytosine-specific restriction protein A